MPNFLDIEASGLHFDAYPIEIALHLDGTIHSWLILPERDWTHWSNEAEALHGIPRAMLDQQGVPARQVAIAINELMAESDGLIYSDACAWDEDWINILFNASGLSREFHVLPIEDLFDTGDWARFQLILKTLQKENHAGRHRAAADVGMIYQAWRLTSDSATEPKTRT